MAFRVDSIVSVANYDFSGLLFFTLLREPLRKQAECEEGYLWIKIAAMLLRLVSCRFPFPCWLTTSGLVFPRFLRILAAYVMPNEPAVEHILTDASRILVDKTQNSSLSGYLSGDPLRSYTQAAAIYYAAAHQKISYINPPASFKKTGQKIRTSEHLLDKKLGTCLDMTALLTAYFEQVGLRSVIVLGKKDGYNNNENTENNSVPFSPTTQHAASSNCILRRHTSTVEGNDDKTCPVLPLAVLWDSVPCCWPARHAFDMAHRHRTVQSKESSLSDRTSSRELRKSGSTQPDPIFQYRRRTMSIGCFGCSGPRHHFHHGRAIRHVSKTGIRGTPSPPHPY